MVSAHSLQLDFFNHRPHRPHRKVFSLSFFSVFSVFSGSNSFYAALLETIVAIIGSFTPVSTALSLSRQTFRPPEKPLKIDPVAPLKLNTFGLKQILLQCISRARRQRNPAGPVYHSVPWKVVLP
jgi:hypothetical protein